MLEAGEGEEEEGDGVREWGKGPGLSPKMTFS